MWLERPRAGFAWHHANAVIASVFHARKMRERVLAMISA
jgi:hypothetical protein